jgi:uncharacterized cysteine cluster protein YcgN (CxxCxxCC family)
MLVGARAIISQYMGEKEEKNVVNFSLCHLLDIGVCVCERERERDKEQNQCL